VFLALYVASNGSPKITYVTYVQQLLPNLPAQASELRLGDWPARLSTRDEETRQKTLSSLGDEPAIAVVIDDLGGDVPRTKEAIALPANVTMSFLPYPDTSEALSHRAFLAGHEVIVHLPMQPLGNENPGAHALMSGLSPEELQERTQWALSRVSDYDGANNHMGSRFTASRADLLPVMQQLKQSGIFFLDSRTTEKTLAETVARESGLLAGSRDVFLDDEQSADAVEHQLARAEEVARKNGTVIAIGHPHPQTLKSLAAWAKALKSRGYRLLPVRDVLKLRDGHPQSVSVLTPARSG
jgi:polysaccharide deacetylase 2 family uncharacterized protein YibQ